MDRANAAPFCMLLSVLHSHLFNNSFQGLKEGKAYILGKIKIGRSSSELRTYVFVQYRNHPSIVSI